MESQIIRIEGEDDITIRAKYDDFSEYEAFVYWLIDCGTVISPAIEEDVEEEWFIGPTEEYEEECETEYD